MRTSSEVEAKDASGEQTSITQLLVGCRRGQKLARLKYSFNVER